MYSLLEVACTAFSCKKLVVLLEVIPGIFLHGCYVELESIEVRMAVRTVCVIENKQHFLTRKSSGGHQAKRRKEEIKKLYLHNMDRYTYLSKIQSGRVTHKMLIVHPHVAIPQRKPLFRVNCERVWR
jgi:hypothetical protein